MKELKSMPDFVLSYHKRPFKKDLSGYLCFVNYARFLKQPLALGMFVPCDDEGNVLENPINTGMWSKWTEKERNDYCDKYQQAKERVLFEGLDKLEIYNEWIEASSIDVVRHLIKECKNVESIIPYDLTLTQTALTKIYG